MIVLFILSPILASTLLIAIVPIVCLTIFYGRYLQTIQKTIQAEKAKMTTIADESFGNIRTVKAFSNEEEEIRKFMVGNKLVYKIGFKKALLSALYSFLTQLVMYGAMATIIYIASILYQRRKITIGAITSFYFYMLMLLWNF